MMKSPGTIAKGNSKSRLALWGAILILGALILAWWFWNENRASAQVHGADPEVHSGPGGAEESSSGSGKERPPKEPRHQKTGDPYDAVNWQNRFTKPRITEKQVDEYLNSVGRTPSALAFSLLLYPREEIFQELRQHPEDPIACLALATNTDDEVERGKWADRLIRCDPENSIGYLLKAAAADKAGRSGAGREQLQLALEKDHYSSYGSEIDGHFEAIKSIAPAAAADVDYMNRGNRWVYQALTPALRPSLFTQEGDPQAGLKDYERLMSRYQEIAPDKLDPILGSIGQRIFKNAPGEKSAENQATEKSLGELYERSHQASDARYNFLRALSDHQGEEGVAQFATSFRSNGWDDTEKLRERTEELKK